MARECSPGGLRREIARDILTWPHSRWRVLFACSGLLVMGGILVGSGICFLIAGKSEPYTMGSLLVGGGILAVGVGATVLHAYLQQMLGLQEKSWSYKQRPRSQHRAMMSRRATPEPKKPRPAYSDSWPACDSSPVGFTSSAYLYSR